ncbi:MAG: hypothetical protein GY828_04940 [Candidatus Gracilibacteria bacterium]|nr:hypothetical protein [Candidatus Gracilibacteria bacterium]
MRIEQIITSDKKPRLKKYLFLISILFFIVTGIHLGYKYFYNDAQLYPIEGGNVSEGLIGDFPSLNPLKPLHGNNGYLISLLYRSLLTYNNDENKIDSDIASCDISNLRKIECFVQEGITWSNGEAITPEDILATYELLGESGINPTIASLLKKATITTKNNSIVFKVEENDINFLNIFFQPILPKSTIESIGKEKLEGNFSTIGQIYSGKFVILSVQEDSSLGLTKIILEKNKSYVNNPVLIEQLIIKLFPDTQTFNKNKNTINIFQDDKNLIGSSIPRFASYEYTLPQYVSLFLNKETLKNNDFRNILLHNISRENLITHLGSENIEKVLNPYLSDYSIESDLKNKNFEKIIQNMGFEKKSKLIQSIIPKKIDPVVYSSEVTQQEIPEEMTIDDFQKDSLSLISPNYVEKYNFVGKNDILLTGKVSKGVEKVYINDYTLNGFTAGDDLFYYRLRESYGNLQNGINTYKIYFEKNEKKELIEEVTFVYHPNEKERTKEINILLTQLYKEKIQQEKIKTIKKIEEKAPLNEENMTLLSELDENYYYNQKYQPFTLKLHYVDADKNIRETAIYIKNTLDKIGIQIDLIPISIQELSTVLDQNDSYDLVLAGINLGYFEQNIFPYYHSSQVENGYNISNFKKNATLDISLEKLKENILPLEEQIIEQTKVLNFIKDENIIKTLYTPKQRLIIDKNIKTTSFPEKLQNKQLRTTLYNNLYTNEQKIVNFDQKNIFNFLKYLMDKLYE